MENYWSELVWQNGGDIVNADKSATLLGTPEAAGGIQFLQDLIWKEKVMPDPALFVETGDAFEQGKAAMEANGSWLARPHAHRRRQRPGVRVRPRPAPEGRGRALHLGQPDGRRRVQGLQVARRAPGSS